MPARPPSRSRTASWTRRLEGPTTADTKTPPPRLSARATRCGHVSRWTGMAGTLGSPCPSQTYTGSGRGNQIQDKSGGRAAPPASVQRSAILRRHALHFSLREEGGVWGTCGHSQRASALVGRQSQCTTHCLPGCQTGKAQHGPVPPPPPPPQPLCIRERGVAALPCTSPAQQTTP